MLIILMGPYQMCHLNSVDPVLEMGCAERKREREREAKRERKERGEKSKRER